MTTHTFTLTVTAPDHFTAADVQASMLALIRCGRDDARRVANDPTASRHAVNAANHALTLSSVLRHLTTTEQDIIKGALTHLHNDLVYGRGISDDVIDVLTQCESQPLPTTDTINQLAHELGLGNLE